MRRVLPQLCIDRARQRVLNFYPGDLAKLERCRRQNEMQFAEWIHRRLRGDNVQLGFYPFISDADSEQLWITALRRGLLFQVGDPRYRNWCFVRDISWRTDRKRFVNNDRASFRNNSIAYSTQAWIGGMWYYVLPENRKYIEE